jgi:hypothetical protein
MASAQGIVNLDGSETIGTLPMGHVNVPAVNQESITVDFNDLLSPTAKNGMKLADQRSPFSFKTDFLHRLQAQYLHL